MGTVTNPNLVRAVRTRAIAGVARTRATERPDVAAQLLAVANFLDTAAAAFETEEPDVIDGVTITNTLPFDASMPLMEAAWLVEETPGTGLPDDFTAYVVDAFKRRAMPAPPMAQFAAAGPDVRAHAVNVLARLTTAHNDLHAARTPEDVTTCLQAALTLHDTYQRIMATLVGEPAAPVGEPAATVVDESTPLDLTDVSAYTVGIIRLAESKGLRPTDGGAHRGVRRIHLNAGGPHGTFGTIQIGQRSGKILRAEVIQGNGGTPRRAKGTNAVRALLTDTRAHSCPDRCTAFSADSCRP
ncbi:hypothetical protein [Streptomyces hirsutus]|uniref:hypothetical protein n=1 Tax=Streptomyces hirsutus TaxID=35620 RepID=UPI0033273435